MRRHRIEIAHTNTTVTPTAAFGAKLAGVPHVWHIREFFSDMPSVWSVFQWYISAFSVCIICNSKATASQFSASILRRRVRVIYNAIPEEELPDLSNAARTIIRAQHGISSSSVVVGVVGRIKWARKGQDTFIKGAALLSQRYPQARFAIIGTPFPGNESHLHRLKALASDLGLEEKVLFAGDIEDVQQIYGLLDIVVLPSGTPEPFGNVLLEGMSYSLPVIGTWLGGIPEIIVDGDNGFLIPPNSPEALAAAIGPLINDPKLRELMGVAGRNRFVKQFDFSKMVSLILGVYEEAAEGNHRKVKPIN